MIRSLYDLIENVVEVVLAAVVVGKVTKTVAPDVYEGIRKGSLERLAATFGYKLAGEKELDVRRIKLLEQSQQYAARSDAACKQRRDSMRSRRALLETTFLGGDSLANYVREGRVPDEVQKAYELQYPELSASHSLIDELRTLGPQRIQGLVSGIKGKLFELRYVDYLNDGHLPSGYNAALATSANQPGWDIMIKGPDQHTAELIQLKATNSVDYIRHALETYPHIDVVSTSEVYSHLMMQGVADHVSDSGISEHELDGVVRGGLDASHVHMHFGPPILALAISAWSSYNRDDLDSFEKSRQFGERATTSWLAYIAGGAVAVATQTWWLAIVGSMGTRIILNNGWKKKKELDRLDEQVQNNELVLARMPASVSGAQGLGAI